jgi:hypothetical protein
MTKNFVFKLRRGSTFEWVDTNPVLLSGEPGIELDTGKFKIGNGVTPWSQLPYFSNDDLIAVMIQNAISEATIEGTPGPQGPEGPPGPQGDPGIDYSGPTITVSSTAPSTPAVGDIWIDTSV